ncbi:MAG: AMP-binding protein [Candidatus Krumholzibacteriota bacterium]|nr:AMP-binding protein [Candidatus Krumholzibacteriota bacterium]
MSLVQDSFLLSPLQKGMLFNALYEPRAGIDITQMVFNLREKIDIPLFKESWNRVVDRHQILRAAFRWEGLEDPVQDVYDRVAFPIEEIDLRNLNGAEQEKRIKDILQADRSRGFDLKRAPIHRLAILDLAEDYYRVVWTSHHILLDASSIVIVLIELFKIYEAALMGQDPELEKPVQFEQYVRWYYNSDFSSTPSFWKKTLQGFTKPVPVGVKTGREEADAAGQMVLFKQAFFPDELKDRISEVSKEQGVTPYTMIKLAFAILLSRYSGEDDIVFGAVLGNRRNTVPGSERIVGLFINNLPVRVKVDPDKSVAQCLREIRELQVSSREHIHAPLFEIQKWSDLFRGSTLFESFINFFYQPWDAALEAADGKWKSRDIIAIMKTNYPLGFIVGMLPHFSVRFNYSPQRFDDSAVSSMLAHIQKILENMVQDPEQPIGTLDILTGEEKETLLRGWNRTEKEYRSDACAHALFEEQALAHPDSTAAIFRQERVTYGELNARAEALARVLRSQGIKKETFTGICLDRSPELLVAILAVFKAGGAYVPLDPAYPASRFSFIFEDTGMGVLLTQDSYREILPPFEGKIIFLDAEDYFSASAAEGIISGESSPGDSAYRIPPSGPAGKTEDDKSSPLEHDYRIPAPGPEGRAGENESSPHDTAYLIYTSGSTGKPKGVMVEHASLVNFLFWVRDDLFGEDIDLMPALTTPAFDASLKQLLGPLICGEEVWLIPQDLVQNPGQLLSAIGRRERIALNCVPSLWEVMLDLIESGQAAAPVESLRALYLGGDVLSQELADRTFKIFPRLKLKNTYGPTECTSLCIVGDVLPGKPITIGRPIANARIYLLDKHLRPVPPGIPGEIYIGGEGVSRGYLNRPRLTAEKFIDDPFTGEEGRKLYRSGDLGRYRYDGNIEFLRRIDLQVKFRGFRIEPGEIEAALREHPSVRECLAMLREDRPGAKQLVAYIVAADRSQQVEENWREFLRTRIPEYMIPTAFVYLDALPLSPSGKVDRNALPQPQQRRAEREGGYRAPRNEAEKRLARIWEKLLGISPVGIDDDFFELGGHSLLAVRLFAQIQKTFGKNLPLAIIFEAPTIALLAGQVSDQDWQLSGKSLVPITSGGSKPPVYCVHAYGGGVFYFRELARRLGSDQPFYGLQAVGLDGKQPALRTVEEMAERYINEILAIQPSGPYYLSGRCLGAYIALEMACQLRKRGEQVAFLGILDSYWTPKSKPTERNELADHRYILSRLQPPLKIVYILTRIAEKFIKAKNRLGTEMCRGYFQRGKTLPDFLRNFYINTLLPVINRQAELNYTPSTYDGKITFLQASAETARDPRSFWGKHTTGGLEVYLVEANHRDILVEPYVGRLADRMNEVLKKARIESEQAVSA